MADKPAVGVENVATSLAVIADRARAKGRRAKADKYLLLAWAAYDAHERVSAAAFAVTRSPSAKGR